MTLPLVHAVWIGRSLGPIHAACLRSFVRSGHNVTLHVYEEPTDAPDGIVLSDAGELFPASRVSEFKGMAVVADLIRYEILARGLGLYVDCDVYCLRPLEDSPFILGWENDGVVNNAILKLPHDHPMVRDLCRLGERAFVPPWLSRAQQNRLRFMAMVGRPVGIERMRSGTTSPRAVTWYAKAHGIEAEVRPSDVLYPVPPQRASMLVDPDLTIQDLITKRTRYLHLYYGMLKPLDLSRPPKGSPLDCMIRDEIAVADD